MSLFRLALFMITLSIFAACQITEVPTVAPLDPDAPGSPNSIPKIKEEIGDDYIGHHTYNQQGQLVEEKYNNGVTRLYKYTPGLLTIENYDSAGTLTEVNTMKLNEKGLRVDYTEAQYGRLYEFEYDSLDRIVKEIAKKSDGSLYYQWYYFYNKHGNLVKDSVYRYESNIWRVYNHEHYPDIKNTIGNANYGKFYLGESSKNYRSRSVYTSSVGELTVIDYLPPVLDDKGRTTDRTVFYTQSNGNTGSYIYKYNYY